MCTNLLFCGRSCRDLQKKHAATSLTASAFKMKQMNAVDFDQLYEQRKLTRDTKSEKGSSRQKQQRANSGGRSFQRGRGGKRSSGKK